MVAGSGRSVVVVAGCGLSIVAVVVGSSCSVVVVVVGNS